MEMHVHHHSIVVSGSWGRSWCTQCVSVFTVIIFQITTLSLGLIEWLYTIAEDMDIKVRLMRRKSNIKMGESNIVLFYVSHRLNTINGLKSFN